MFLNTNLKQKVSDFDYPKNCLIWCFTILNFEALQSYLQNNVSNCDKDHNVPHAEQKRVHIEFMSEILNGKTQIKNYQNKHRKKNIEFIVYTQLLDTADGTQKGCRVK